jgi:uncharacterized protein
MTAVKRRHFLIGAGVLGAVGVGARFGFPRLARSAAPDGPLSVEAEALIDRAWQGINPGRVLDAHVHVVGVGAGGTGCYVNPNMTDMLRHPVQAAKFGVYRIASGITDMEDADAQYVQQLLSLAKGQPRHGRFLALAFDEVYREDGSVDRAASEFHTPNDYVLRLAKENPNELVPAASIHPYRLDATTELERVVAEGAAAVKWLPNAQLIDPASAKCDPFYAKLAELGVPLLTHAGEEKAVEAVEAQKLGNPLRLRRALDAGVKVIVCHAASSGDGEDLDAAGDAKPMVPNFDLFLRMVAEPRHHGRLFADISALVQYNRAERLADLLRREDLHPILINGSDYPLPAINVLVRTGTLEDLGYITAEEREVANEIDRHDPLLFDFVLKRTLRLRENGKEHRFADSVFMTPPGLFRGI